MQINQAKTEILAFNTDPALLNDINNFGKGTIKTRVKEDMEKVNFDYLIGRTKKATNRIVKRNQCSVYTRALLIEAILHSQTNHIIMSLKLSKSHLEEIQEIIYNALLKKRKKIMKMHTWKVDIKLPKKGHMLQLEWED